MAEQTIEKQWLDAIARAVYPHKNEGFTYAGPFIVEEIEKLRADNKELRACLSTVLGILPQDSRGSTYWEDGDGYFVEHPWYTRAVKAAKEK